MVGYELCLVLLDLAVRLVGLGFGSIIDIVQWARICTYATGNPYGN